MAKHVISKQHRRVWNTVAIVAFRRRTDYVDHNHYADFELLGYFLFARILLLARVLELIHRLFSPALDLQRLKSTEFRRTAFKGEHHVS